MATDRNEVLREAAETLDRMVRNAEWRVVVVAHHYDKPPTIYPAPQHVLIPTVEYREADDIWVGKLPFFGLTGYAKTREGAGARVVEMLSLLSRTHTENVLEGRYTRESVLARAATEDREGGEGCT